MHKASEHTAANLGPHADLSRIYTHFQIVEYVFSDYRKVKCLLIHCVMMSFILLGKLNCTTITKEEDLMWRDGECVCLCF